jgi:nucleoside-diphosphate-sugar epimerase
MPTALITGLRGFTGHYLAAELEAAGYRVCGTVHHDGSGAAGELVTDLCDREAVRGMVAEVRPDVVAHLAAISFVAHGDAEAIYRTNVVGTRNLLQALGECDKTPRAVLLASSANVYGNAPVDPITESTPADPANDYAVSKLAMEYMARLWMQKLPIVMVRPFNYTGVGQAPHFLLPKIVDHFRRGAQEIELGNLDVARDFSDVRTVVAAYRRLIELAPAGETFNVCSGRAVSLQEVLERMAAIAGYRIRVTVNPAFVRENEVKRLRGSNAKLTGAVGALDPIPLEQTLRWMFEAGSA